MQLSAISLFVGVTLLAALSPGLNVFLVTSFSVKHGFEAGLRAGLGVFAANLCYAVVSIFGLTAILIGSKFLFGVVKLLGAVYLIWIGLQILCSAIWWQGTNGGAEFDVASRPFARGFLTHFANPKAILYWSALLPQFVPAGANSPLVVLGVLGLTASTIELAVLAGYAYGADRLRVALARAGVKRVIDGLAGTLFVTAGLVLGTNTVSDHR